MYEKGILQTSSGAIYYCINSSDKLSRYLLNLTSPAKAVLSLVFSSKVIYDTIIWSLETTWFMLIIESL